MTFAPLQTLTLAAIFAPPFRPANLFRRTRCTDHNGLFIVIQRAWLKLSTAA